MPAGRGADFPAVAPADTSPPSDPLRGPPSPIEEEGRGGVGIAHTFIETRACKPRHVAGAVKRARRLRKEMPYAQTRLWAALRKLKLNIRREAPLGRFTVDFVQHDARLVIEVDGYWHTAEGRAERDADRDEWMMSEGYLVVRIADRDVEANIATVVLQLERTINARLVSRRRERAEPLERGTGVGS